MPRANKEFVLNYAMNRWQLNFKRNVGPTSDSIRLCNPSSYEEFLVRLGIITHTTDETSLPFSSATTI